MTGKDENKKEKDEIKQLQGASKTGPGEERPAKEEIEKLRESAKKSEEYHDKWLRALAELENTKKRLAKENEEYKRFANEDLILRLLPVMDNFERALASVKHTAESDAVLQGIRLVQKELHALFRDYKVEPIECVGKKFDPHLCEAIGVVESKEHPEDTVVEEIQVGYTMDGRLLRPAIVKISKKEKSKDH